LRETWDADKASHMGSARDWGVERRGALKPGVEIADPTGGNGGIAVAHVAAARGYTLTQQWHYDKPEELFKSP
jgi:hypothetical protein